MYKYIYLKLFIKKMIVNLEYDQGWRKAGVSLGNSPGENFWSKSSWTAF